MCSATVAARWFGDIASSWAAVTSSRSVFIDPIVARGRSCCRTVVFSAARTREGVLTSLLAVADTVRSTEDEV